MQESETMRRERLLYIYIGGGLTKSALAIVWIVGLGIIG